MDACCQTSLNNNLPQTFTKICCVDVDAEFAGRDALETAVPSLLPFVFSVSFSSLSSLEPTFLPLSAPVRLNR